MKPSLQVRLSQHLALTPQLQQSIRLLQLSTLELHQEVEQMLEQNPFLEPDEDYAAEPALAAPERPLTREERAAADAEQAGADSFDAAEAAPTLDTVELGATERDDWENGTERDDFDGIRETPSTRNGAVDDDDLDPIDRASPGITLQDHLRQQLLGMRLAPEDAAAVMVLIESLDEDGYLADPLEEIAERLLDGNDDPEAREDLLERLRCALKWLQNMEPTGVGARSLSECLCLQLRAMERSEAQIIALMICKDHLEALARRDVKKLMAATGADEELLRQAQALIVSLEPKPGRPFTRAEANVIVPDVIVQKSGRGWKVVLNPDVMPKLRINDLYAQALKQQRSSDSGQALSARLQEARWFMKNIQQRFETIQRVSQAIVERQKNFFSHGEIAMKPLVLREIADELGLHESTISRVTTAKYMATPFGTFELKYFFGSSLNTDAGGNASSTAVRALIKQLVSAEDPKKPLSDSQISQLLEEQGIQVARRTVAKYREALKIAPANLRKSI
ncbi:RNA polymerase factor sigma-54 [Caldimonas thermodepolymerans]|nr:RNA polymerase factor sigma-54 [Caldimonas thermodepolymerans]PPE70122.1 RNA polymerase factor sigma-54 [Caldimonas thermodepolymerans]QPC31802.1 RNA polymerase factor sigma-54 [Caldimonas thermodepolymerans]UZG44585.1 RNA polymerase factor sigma-54 [Caldimonas thermodepolymerans]UZG48229.1 RNA polymerase factor sigma-54 [Caldimonas thermodepolymerans]